MGPRPPSMPKRGGEPRSRLRRMIHRPACLEIYRVEEAVEADMSIEHAGLDAALALDLDEDAVVARAWEAVGKPTAAGSWPA